MKNLVKKAKQITEDKKKGTPPLNREEAVFQKILKDFGPGTVINGEELANHDKKIISVSPAVDLAHNGGFQEGTFIILGGPPRCGKTTLCLHFSAKCQLPQFDERQVIYFNVETRLEKRDITGIPGLLLDDRHFRIIRSSPASEDEKGNFVPGIVLLGKQYLQSLEDLLTCTVKKVCIIDSISSMIGETEWNEGLDAKALGENQRLFGNFMKRMAPVIASNSHIVIGIVHEYANMNARSPGSPKTLEALTSSANYGLQTKLRCTYFKTIYDSSDKFAKPIGQEGEWKCERSPLGPPNTKFTSYIRYGEGIDEIKELMNLAKEVKFIDCTVNGWHTLLFVEEDDKPYLHGEEVTRQYFKDHPEHIELLRTKLYEALGLS